MLRAMTAPDLLLVSTPLEARDLPGGVCPSLSNLTLGSALRRAGADVAVLDPSVDLPDGEGPLLDRIAQAVLDERPRAVGISCLSTVEGRFGLALARALKARTPRLPVVLGGVWATGAAEAVVRRFPEVDGVVAGPGEDGAEAIARGASFADVPGLVWRFGADVVRNAPGAQPTDPAPLDPTLMRAPDRYQIFCWLTSRGCPFSCHFCTERLAAPSFRADPDPKVDADLAAIEALPRDCYLWICDPLFGVPRDRAAHVLERLRRTGRPFLCESRVDVLHPDDVPHLAEAGCDFIYFGLESASGRSLRALGKIGAGEGRLRRYLDGARALVRACLRHDILPVFGVLNPVPGDGPEDLAATLDFLEELSRIPRRGELGPCFHAFPLRLDLGAPYQERLDWLNGTGATFTAAADPLLEDRYLLRASPTVDEGMAEAFRERVRARNPASPEVRRRLMRSFPRRYVAF